MNHTAKPTKLVKVTSVHAMTFQQWYETTFNKPLGLYLGNSLKKALVEQYEKETGNKYEG